MTGRILVVLFAGQEIGQVERNQAGRLTFRYSEKWQRFAEAVPLSLSMPLAAKEHRHEKIDAFMNGLLPDNEVVLARWARDFQVSARNAFSLLAYVGEDCPGAVQFIPPEKLAAVLKPSAPEIAWLDEAEVAERLRILRNDQSSWRMPRDAGQFSLAGAQPKTALYFENERWGVPSGRTPTTHILKPPSAEYEGHAENEHFCLTLAREVGLPAASSEIRRFNGETVFVTERYDRIRLAKTQPVLRLHQEDMCQALGLYPTSKYQNDGGLGPETIIQLLKTNSSRPADDVGTFIDALAFNWMIGGTDAHAKNYSLLHGGGGRVRLAPLYDVASVLPYPGIDPQSIKLAMKIGDEYRLRDIGPRQWHKLANAISYDQGMLTERLAALALKTAEQAGTVRDRLQSEGVVNPIINRLAETISTRAAHCSELLRM